jgi:hypothetical protein
VKQVKKTVCIFSPSAARRQYSAKSHRMQAERWESRVGAISSYCACMQFRMSAASDEGVSRCKKHFLTFAWHSLSRSFSLIEKKMNGQCLATDQNYQPNLRISERYGCDHIDQIPPTFRSLTECIFLRSRRSDRIDRRFRTHRRSYAACNTIVR